MAEQLLRNPDIEPTDGVIAQALGPAKGAYQAFVGGLKDHDINLEYRYYPDGSAWLGKGLHQWTGVRGGQKEVTAFWLSIWDSCFKVTIYIPEKFRAAALGLSLNTEVKSMIEGAKQVGKLKFFPVIFDLTSDELLEQVYTLIDFRKKLK